MTVTSIIVDIENAEIPFVFLERAITHNDEQINILTYKLKSGEYVPVTMQQTYKSPIHVLKFDRFHRELKSWLIAKLNELANSIGTIREIDDECYAEMHPYNASLLHDMSMSPYNKNWVIKCRVYYTIIPTPKTWFGKFMQRYRKPIHYTTHQLDMFIEDRLIDKQLKQINQNNK